MSVLSLPVFLLLSININTLRLQTEDKAFFILDVLEPRVFECNYNNGELRKNDVKIYKIKDFLLKDYKIPTLTTVCGRSVNCK